MPDRPYTLLSCAVSVDGYLDDTSSRRLILSGPEDLDEVDELRATADAILVGAGTVRADNPRLLIRDPARSARREAQGRAPHPLRVTLTATGDLDPAARFFTGPGTPLVYCSSEAFPAAEKSLQGRAVIIDAGAELSLRAVLEDLYAERTVATVLIEGGSRVLRDALAGDLADELRLAIAPFFVADPAAPRFALPARSPHTVANPMSLLSVHRVGEVAVLRYRPNNGTGAGLSLGTVDMGLTEDSERTTVQPGNTARSRFFERLRPFLDWARRHPRVARGAGLAIAALVLFLCYLREAQTYHLGADPAAQALQAWQMWHGNPLLRGWWLGDVNFYTVELPMNVIVEMVIGLRPDVVDVGAALVYTAVVLLTAVLARGRARGWEGVVRALLGAGIMLAPSLVYGTRVLLQGPDHMGTMIPILLMLLVLDRAPERAWVPLVVGALLTWAQVSDPLATYAAAAALGVACGVRACSEVARRRPTKDRWYDAALVVAALVSVALAHLILAKIHSAGGFYFPPPKNGVGFAPLSELPVHSRLTVYSVLILFGADFVGQPFGVNTFLALMHLVGVGLGFWGLWIGLRGFFGRMDRVTQVMVAGTIIILVAGVFGTYMTAPVVGAHEIIPVLPFCAALAGRLLGGRLVKVRLEPVLALGLACYLGALAYNDIQPIQAPEHTDLANWLTTHHLKYGLAGYWESNITTLDSDGKVRVASLADGGVAADAYESDASWYNPAVSTANFIVSVSSPASNASLISASAVRARFGVPAHTYHFKEYTIMVYGYNLLTRLSAPTTIGSS